MRPKLWTIPLVALIAAMVWCSARVKVSERAPVVADALQSVMPLDAEAPGEVRFMDVRACARRAVARELLAGRLTVPEAAAVFGWLDRQHPAIPTSMKVHAERAMASGSPIGSELSAVAGHDGEWLCLRTVGYARNLAWGECPDRAEAISAALDEALIRVWRSGEARALPAIDENVCRTLLFRARAELFAAPGQASTLDASDLRLIDRGN